MNRWLPLALVFLSLPTAYAGQAIVTAIQTTENTRLQGTRDLHTWTNLASTTAVVAGATRTFTVDAPESYQYYRLVQ